MRIFYLLLIVLLFCNSVQGQQPNITSIPNWVVPNEPVDKEIIDTEGGYQYLLMDLQESISEESYYKNYAIKVVNSDGISAFSDIEVTFDPSYQELAFHKMNIIRDGKIINKLGKDKFNIIQREESMERAIYDGSLSAIVNLTDVRENDIISYSFTVRGFNPINNGSFSTGFYHQYNVPVSRIFNRIVTDNTSELQYKLYNGASEPKINETTYGKEYIWDIDATDYIFYDSNIPIWFNAQKKVLASTYKSWSEVVDWALPLYKLNSGNGSEFEILNKSGLDKEYQIIDAIRWVQDNVRYLGLESGISAYKPTQPSKVYDRRYGDCKDKSLLLVSLLREIGVEAYPLLVNTESKKELKTRIPSHLAFNHAIVYFRFEAKDYFVDPTISDQGGNLENMSHPDYGMGLLIKPGESDLINIPKPGPGNIRIYELIDVDSAGRGGADFQVRTEYTGFKADNIRSYFKSTSHESIKRDYLNFYSGLYSRIESMDDLKFLDDERISSNKIIIEESYRINDFWLKDEGSDLVYAETYPIVLNYEINHTQTADRTMPYYLGLPFTYYQTTNIDLPEEWYIENHQATTEGDGFVYENIVRGSDKSLTVIHNYQLINESISADSVDRFIRQHDQIQADLNYILTYNKDLDGFKFSWATLILAIISLAIAAFFLIKLYKEYDPIPYHSANNQTIGGWLVLPAIGITISPLLMLYTIFVSHDYFNHNLWIALSTLSEVNTTSLLITYGFEIVYNILFLCFGILVVVLFYKRRTSLPRLVSIYYVLSFVGQLGFLLIAEHYFPSESADADSMKDITRSLIAAIIWVPYFNISKRVKDTFCITRNNKAVIEEGSEV